MNAIPPIRLAPLAAALAVISCVAWPASAAETPARPNFVLLMADDQGYGDVGYTGNAAIKTPVLDEMASSGLRFDRFYAAAPVCSPTRGSVLTGRHPNRFGCFSWGYTLRPEEVTLAEVLQQAGYATGHFGKWHLGSFAPGSGVSPGDSGFDTWFSSPNFYENSPLMCADGKVVKTEGEGSQVTVDAALEFIRAAAKREQPFLAVVWFGSPHLPHQAIEEDLRLYADQPPAIAHYWGEITAMDRAVGNLRRELRSLGIADNTLVWYTSDNGATRPGSTGGLRGRKGELWEGGIRVPTIVEWPARIASPRATRLACSTVDLYPTLLELAGAKPAHQPPLDGTSLVPLLDGKLDSRPPLGFWVYPAPGQRVQSQVLLSAMLEEQQAGRVSAPPERLPPPDVPADPPGHAAWMDGDWKLHRIPAGGTFRYELYNLAADPNETADLAAEQPARLAAMQEQLAAWQQSVVRSLKGEDDATPRRP